MPTPSSTPGRVRAGATELMRALVVRAPGVARVEDVARPRPHDDEVVALVEAVGICGSDRELLAGSRPAPFVSYPVVPGHEWVGTVVERGDAVGDIEFGTTIVAEGLRGCGSCARCAEGRRHLCGRGYRETGFTEPGALAAFVCVPSRLVHPLAPVSAYPVETAALLEPAACVATGLMDAGGIEWGSRVAVVGDGTLAQIAVVLARASSPEQLAVFGVRHERLALARRLGATSTAEAADNGIAQGADGFDFVFEASGSPEGAELAVRLARRGGSVVLAGIAGARSRPSLDADRVALGHLRVQGVFGSSRAAWACVTELWQSGQLDLSELVARRFPLGDAATAMGWTGEGERGVKALVLPNMEEW